MLKRLELSRSARYLGPRRAHACEVKDHDDGSAISAGQNALDHSDVPRLGVLDRGPYRREQHAPELMAAPDTVEEGPGESNDQNLWMALGPVT